MGFNIVSPYMDCVTHKWISPSLIYHSDYLNRFIRNLSVRKVFWPLTIKSIIFFVGVDVKKRPLLDLIGNLPTRCSFLLLSEAVVQLQNCCT